MDDHPPQAPLAYRSLLGPLSDDPDLWQEVQGRRDLSDGRDGAVYAIGDELRLVVDVALATGRPLLLRGEPRSGKSSLAAYIARNLGWRYYEHVVTSTTTAEDLLWRFDAVRRLSDAQAQRRLVDAAYVEPGVLWWVIDPDSAALRGSAVPVTDPAVEPYAELNAQRRQGHAIVLIDELDKADPDVPNGLLVPLGSWAFTVAETGIRVDGATFEQRLGRKAGIGAGGRLLVVITTNEERQLPPALLRRCVVHAIPVPDVPTLERIATLHVHGPAGGEPTAADQVLFHDVAIRLHKVRAELAGQERLPSTAEYLDAVRACRELRVTPDDQDRTWQWLERVTLTKPAR
ncbi:MAG: AAA family ATPase [Pseudonocardiaceae bacterium]